MYKVGWYQPAILEVYRQVFDILHCSLGFASRRAVLGQSMSTGSADDEYVSIVFLVRFDFHFVTEHYMVPLRQDYDLALSDCFLFGSMLIGNDHRRRRWGGRGLQPP